ncbi:MAG TPA: hypothetical protein VMM55_12240 [Thermohalobaculum sp.]|nr:hypothetical protein [Thermohalobaculum sp.]
MSADEHPRARLGPALLLAAAGMGLAPLPVPAAGPDGAAEAEAPAPADREALFAALAAAATEAEAREIEGALWEFWLTAPDPEAQALLDRALDRRRWGDLEAAIEALDQLIAGWPDYAEGWNQRATVRFLRGEDDLSLADVAETLRREPRHFGALAGKALILIRQGRPAEAQLVLIEAVRIDPWLRERSLLQPGSDL